MITDHYNAALSHLLCVTLVSLDNEVAIINTTTLKKNLFERDKTLVTLIWNIRSVLM